MTAVTLFVEGPGDRVWSGGHTTLRPLRSGTEEERLSGHLLAQGDDAGVPRGVEDESGDLLSIPLEGGEERDGQVLAVGEQLLQAGDGSCDCEGRKERRALLTHDMSCVSWDFTAPWQAVGHSLASRPNFQRSQNDRCG